VYYGGMPRFRVLIKQVGEGCDYTIGCGYRFSGAFEAEDATAAAAAIKRIFTHCDEVQGANGEWTFPQLSKKDRLLHLREGVVHLDSETKIEFVMVVPDGVVLPVSSWYSELAAHEAARVAYNKEAEERALLENLQAKYPK